MRVGKYTAEALEYNLGLTKLEDIMSEIVLELKLVKAIFDVYLNNEDALSYYVNKFNEDIMKETENLVNKCIIDKISITMRSKFLDEENPITEIPDIIEKAGDVNE